MALAQSTDDFVLLHLLSFPDLAAQAVRAILKRVEIFNALRCPHCKVLWDHYLFCANQARTLDLSKKMQMVEYIEMLRRTQLDPETLSKVTQFLQVFASTPRASLKKEEGRVYLRSLIQADASRKALEAIRSNPSPEIFQSVMKNLDATTRGLIELPMDIQEAGLVQPLKCLGEYLGTTVKIPYGIDYLDEVTYGGMVPGTTTAIIGPTGGGKCLAKGTLVLMYSGVRKRVEDIEIGDLVMGPDSKPRLVLRLGRGRDVMYRVKPTKGDSWVCNAPHLITVYACDTVVIGGKKHKKGELSEVTAEAYYNEGRSCKKMLKLVRTGVDFPPVPAPEVDPYLIGVYLGDGGVNQSFIHNPDEEILSYCEAAAVSMGWKATRRAADGCTKLSFDGRAVGAGAGVVFRREALVDGEKRILPQYLLGSRKTRRELLAGLLDADGWLHGHNFFEISVKGDGLSEDILFLSRSLGLAAYDRPAYKKCQTGAGGIYHRITISGDVSLIPTKVKRKQASPRKQIKDVLHTGFELERLPEDDYYGFTLDGDGRFVLGDFTITHNTMTAISIVMAQAMQANYTLWLTYEQSLMGDLAERLMARASGAPLPSVRNKALSELPEAAVDKLSEMSELFGDYLFVRDFSQPLKDEKGNLLDESKQRVGCAKDIIELLETMKRAGKKPKVVVLDWLGEMVAMIAAATNRDAVKDFQSIAIPEVKELQTYCKQEDIALIIFHQLRADLNNAAPSRIPNKNEAMNWAGMATRMDQTITMGTMRGAQVCWFVPGKNRTGVPLLRKIRLDGDNVRFVPADDWVLGPNGDFINPDEPIPDVHEDSNKRNPVTQSIDNAYGKPESISF